MGNACRPIGAKLLLIPLLARLVTPAHGNYLAVWGHFNGFPGQPGRGPRPKAKRRYDTSSSVAAFTKPRIAIYAPNIFAPAGTQHPLRSKNPEKSGEAGQKDLYRCAL